MLTAYFIRRRRSEVQREDCPIDTGDSIKVRAFFLFGVTAASNEPAAKSVMNRLRIRLATNHFTTSGLRCQKSPLTRSPNHIEYSGSQPQLLRYAASAFPRSDIDYGARFCGA
jgi:hypothetical protein